LASALASSACQSLTVKPFTGTVIDLDIAHATANKPGEHYELWGRNQDDNIIRISYLVNKQEVFGLQLRLAISPSDPCIISDAGYLLTDPAAYPGNSDNAGIVQTPAQQAAQVVLKIRQVTGPDLGGLQDKDLYAVTPVDGNAAPQLAAGASAAARLAACQAYWAKGPDAYTPDPYEVAVGRHGTILGFVDYQTTQPLQSFSDIYLDSPYDLSNLVEMWFTTESVPPEQVDPQHRGPIWMLGKRSDPGRDTFNFTFNGDNGVSGTMVLSVTQPASAF
jgi:hypothetical protein